MSKKALTYDEYRRKLLEKYEKNPDDPDPEVQQFKKEFEEFKARFAPSQEELNRLAGYYKSAFASIQPLLPQMLGTVNVVKSNFENFQVAYKSIQPLLNQIQVYKPPQYLLEAMADVAESVRRMSEPMRAITEVIAVYQTPLLYYKIPELHNNVILGEYEPFPLPIETDKNVEKELLEENKYLQEQIVRLQSQLIENQNQIYSYDPESSTFVVKKSGWGALTFRTKRENPRLGIFFDICMKLLEIKGYIVGDFKEVYISLKDLFDGFNERGDSNISTDLIYSVRSNIVKDKIIPQQLKDYVFISTYNKDKGYCFRIRIKQLVSNS